MGWYGYFQPGMNPNYSYAPYGYPAPYGYMPNGAQSGYVPPVNPAANGAQPGYVPPVNPAANGAQPGYVPMANGFAPQGYPQAPYYGWYAPQGNLPQNPEQTNQ